MALDTSIYNALLQPVRSASDWQQKYAAEDDRALGRQRNALLMQQAQSDMQDKVRVRSEQDGIRNALMGLKPGSSMEDRIGAIEGLGTQTALSQADALRKAMIEQQKAQAGIGKDNAETLSKHWDVFKQLAQGVISNPTPQNAAGALSQWEQYTGRVDQNQRNEIAQLKTPEQVIRWARAHSMHADNLKEQIFTNNTGGRTVTQSYNPVTGELSTLGAITNTQSPDSVASVATQIRGQNMTDARARENNDIQRQASRTQIVTDPNLGVVAVDKGTGTFRPVTGSDGKTIPGENKVAAQKLSGQLTAGIGEARKLLEKATGSGVGAAIDAAGNMLGMSSESNDAATQLETLAGWMTSNVPRMQGPQSDKDTLLYRQMAANVGDRTKPVAARLKALDTLEVLQKKYADVNGTGNQAASAPTVVRTGTHNGRRVEKLSDGTVRYAD